MDHSIYIELWHSRSYIPRKKFHLTNEQLTETFAGPKAEENEEKLGLYVQPTEDEISGN